MNKKIVKGLSRFGLLKWINILTSKKIKDLHVVIPVLGGIGFDNVFQSELWMCDLIEYGISNNPGFFMDIGVNIGQTLIKLRAVNKDLPYIGFEPNPGCVQYIKQLVNRNNFKNIKIIPVGLFSKTSVLTLSLYSESGADQAASVIENFRTDKIFDKINVPVFNYNDIEAGLLFGKMSIIKIDVEGAELEVLTSLKSAIQANSPIILVEILPPYHIHNTDRIGRQNKISFFMHELGYEILRVHKSKSKIHVEKLEKLSEFDIHDNIEFSDYVFISKEKSEHMIRHFNKALA